MKTMIRRIRDALRRSSDPAERKKRVYWEKLDYETPKLYGVRTPRVRKLSSQFFTEIKKEPKEKILQLCEDLLGSGYTEERTIAFDWAFRLKRQYEESDFYLFKSWLGEFVHTWGACDDLCTHALGAFIRKFPEFTQMLKKWTQSPNRWMRRASAVALIYSVRRKELLENVFETADLLLSDEDAVVQKGYGWMLKEASNHYPEAVFSYVMRHKDGMPRIALRYAIEKLSPRQRRKAMQRAVPRLKEE